MSDRTKQLFEEARESYLSCNMINEHEIAIRLGDSAWCMTFTLEFEPTYLDGDETLEVNHE